MYIHEILQEEYEDILGKVAYVNILQSFVIQKQNEQQRIKLLSIYEADIPVSCKIVHLNSQCEIKSINESAEFLRYEKVLKQSCPWCID